jgi:hypothetical protein
MSQIFKGRVILAGDAEGEALVTHTGFNSLATLSDHVDRSKPGNLHGSG